MNFANRPSSSPSVSGTFRLGVNHFGGEESDWGFLEFVLWNRNLSVAEFNTAAQDIATRYCLPFLGGTARSPPPAPQPPPAPPPAPPVPLSGANPPPPPPTGVSGLYLWYAADFAGSTPANFLIDLSGNGRNGVVLNSAGLSLATDAPGTFGIAPTSPAGIRYVSGNVTSALQFGGDLPPSHSYCVVSRCAHLSTHRLPIHPTQPHNRLAPS